ncbi:MAG: AsmA family protein [Vicinamibacterales bacterium]
MLRKLAFVVAFLLLLVAAAAVAVRLWLNSDALRVTLEQQASAALGQPVALGSADATLFPRLGLHLTDVRVGEPAIADIEDITVATGLDLLFEREVRDAELGLRGGFLDPAALAGLGAAAASDRAPTPSAGAGNGVVVSSVRSIRLRDVDVSVGAQRLPLDLDASIDAGQIVIEKATLRIRDTVTHITGTIQSTPSIEGQLTITADALPADVLLGALSTTSADGTAASVQSTAAPYHVAVTLKANAVSLADTQLRAVDALVDATPERVIIEPLTFAAYDGTFRGDARLTSGPRAGSMLHVKGAASGVDVTQLQSSSTNTTTGRLDARVDLQANMEAFSASWLRAVNGSVQLHLHDGRMPGVGVIKQSVIRFANRATAPRDLSTSDTYNRVDAHLQLADGLATISGLTLETPDFTATGNGTFGLLDSSIALNVQLTLTEALSQAAGRDLYRYAREGNRVVLPAIIGGTLEEPTATIDVGDAARRALRNRIEDEAKSALDRLLRRR